MCMATCDVIFKASIIFLFEKQSNLAASGGTLRPSVSARELEMY